MEGLDPRWRPLEREIEAMVSREGCELVLMEVLGHPGQHLLRVRVDRPGGVTIRECERISHRISALLDVADPFPGAFRLEVSSPGVERPLVRRQDFERFAGCQVRITFLEGGSRRRSVVAVLQGCGEETVLVRLSDEEVEIPFHYIVKAHLHYDWDAE